MTLTIEIVADFVCPYCWLGERQLAAALAKRPDLDARTVWRPFELDHRIPEAGVPYLDFMRGLFGDSPEAEARREQSWAALTEAGAKVGAEYRFGDITIRPNTLNAHRLTRWAQAEGKGDACASALFQAVFRDGRDIGDIPTLVAIAGEIGMEAASRDGDDGLAARLAGDEDRDEVRIEEASFQRMGVTGVPTFILDRRMALVGAQDPSVIVQAFDRALAAA